MPIYNTIKIECDSKFPARRAVDTQTEKPAEFWLFNNLKFGVVLLCNGELFSDFSNVSKLVLGVKECDNGGYPLESDTFEILKEVAAADIGKNLTQSQRASGSVHATFAIAAADIAATMKAGMKWLVVQAVDSSGGQLTFFGGNILCKNDASSGTASGAALTRFEDYKTACENAQAAAAGSATQASALRDEAEYFAGQATNAKTAAEQSKNAAASSATTANIMADAAEAESVQAAAANTSATAAAQQAATSSQIAQQAAAQATEISDPEGWRTNTRAIIADLAASKTDVGTFHFGAAGGALQTSGNPMYGVLDQSVCMTFVLDEDMTTAEFSAGNVLNLFGDILYTTGYTGCGVQVPKTGLLQIRAGNGTGSGSTFSGAFYLDDIFGGSSHTTIPAGFHRMCFCWGVSAASSTVKIYRDANLVATATNSAVGADALVRAQNSKLGFFDNSNYKSTSFTSKCVYIGGLRSVAVFNFDMSAADAPYSVADYNAGKAIPPALQSSSAEKRCILAAADYAIARNSTTKLVKDITGNGNDLTVCGDVVGDKDAAVAAFIDELKTQISQTTV